MTTADRLHAHLLHQPGAPALSKLLSRCGEELTISMGDTIPDRAVHVLVGGRPTAEQINACQQLRMVVVPYAGIPPRTSELMREFPTIELYNLHHNAVATAEMAVGLLLAAAKRIVPMDRALRANDWRPRYASNPSVRLAGKTALVLGYGCIGQHVGAALLGLGMTVVATRRSAKQIQVLDEVVVHPASSLDELLPSAHAVIVCVPLTDETRSLIDKRRLALLPRRALLVNVARGPVVEEQALYDALKSGALRGAGIDVWYAYPKGKESHVGTKPSEYPFHELDNVVMSPHRAGGDRDNERLRLEHLADLLLSAARGATMRGRIDLDRGY